MSAFSDVSFPEKVTRQERYARWLAKPKWGELWMERRFGRNVYLWFLLPVALALGANIYVLVNYGKSLAPPMQLQEEVQWDIFNKDQKAEVDKIRSELYQAEFRGTLQKGLNYMLIAKLAGLYLGLLAFLITTHFQRQGTRMTIARLEKQLAEAKEANAK